MGRRGEDEGAPVGIRPAPGKRRPVPAKERVAERVKRLAPVQARVPHVMPLNSGFFQLEQMRAASVAKKRSKTKRKVRGK